MLVPVMMVVNQHAVYMVTIIRLHGVSRFRPRTSVPSGACSAAHASRYEAITMKNVKPKSQASSWAPFAHISFVVLWTATVISNVGTWMHDVASGWLMTSLSPSPLMVALVQAATTLPVFLFALPAGAIADLV